MKKFKITLLAFYVLLVVVLIYESAIPESLSVKEHNFFKKIVNNVSRIFVRTKIINATEIEINNEFKEFYYVGDTLTLDVSVKPDNSSFKEISFSSSDTNIASVDNYGNVSFLKEGSVTITICQLDSNIFKTIDFNIVKKEEPVVEIVEPESMEFKIKNSALSNFETNMGELSKVTVSLFRNDDKSINDREICFSTTNGSVAFVTDGYLYAYSDGETDITVTHKTTGLNKTIHVKVNYKELVEPESFKLIGDKLIYMNDTTIHTYSVEIKPDNVSDIYKKVYFRSFKYDTKNKKTIDNEAGGLTIKWREGKAKASSAGYSAVYAHNYKYDIEKNKVIWGNVSAFVVETRNVFPTFSLKDRRIVLGSPYKLDLSSYVTNKVTYSKFVYSSSDEEVASIDSLGNITAHKKGKTIITVSVDDGYHSAETQLELTVDTKVMEDTMTKKSFSKFVRKGLSHFMGFVTFGFISTFMFLLFISANYDGNKKYFIGVTIVNGLVFAMLTEFIQLFAIERSAQFSDILLDFLGYMLAVSISLLIIITIYLIKKKRSKNNKKEEIDVIE